MNNPVTTPPSTELIITSHGFGLLRKALFENMGNERAKVFLMRFGRDLGISKAQELKKQEPSIHELVRLAGEVHTKLGHVSAIESNGQIKILDDGMLEIRDAYGKWFDSFEAKLHLEQYGPSTDCSCYTLSGFASGYLSTIYEKNIIVKETYCQTMGYSECGFEVNSLDEWLKKDPNNFIFDDQHTIYKELELTYDKLLSQTKNLDKISNYHRKLTDCVAQANSLYHVLSTAYDLLNLPIVVADINNKIIASTGISDSEYIAILNSSRKKLIEHHNETTYEKIGSIHQMTCPIYLDNKRFATCSFIYNASTSFDQNDYQFIERLASVASLCFLKEKISFETTERLKISLLDRLINQHFTSIEEITSQLKYISNKINSPYTLLSINCSPNNNNYQPIDTYELLLQFSKVFKLYFIDCLLTQNSNEIIVFIYDSKPIEQLRVDLEKVLRYMENENPKLNFKLGFSMQFSLLTDFSTHLQQAKQAALLPREKNIIYYEELGLLGHFLSHTKLETIKQIAESELGDLLNKDDKNKDLLYTLYTFLVNGKHLEKTMKDLSLSMGGIQYRIRRIEEVTKKNLKDFYTASYLLLLIESLIILGELEW